MLAFLTPLSSGAIETAPQGMKESGLEPVTEVPATAEPLELELLRTIFVGAPQGIEISRIRQLSEPTNPSTHYHLARAALQVVAPRKMKPSLSQLLRSLLEQLHLPGDELFPGTLPRGYGNDDLVYTLVRALAVSGGARDAERVLIGELGIGSQHKKHVILEALHQLGSRGAKAAIQQASEQSDLWYLASNLLTDYRSPTLVELARFWGTIPPSGRERSRLLELARDGCRGRTGPSLLAVHLLGYLPPHPSRQSEVQEIALLRTLATGAQCSNGRLFASQALALRSRELPLFWQQALERAPSAWERRQLLRAYWVHQPESLAGEALDRLAREPEQMIQWELMWGLVGHEQGMPLRDQWGLWFLSPHFQFRLENKRRHETIGAEGVDRLLDWLDQGRRPLDDRVFEWLLVEVVRGARGAQVGRALDHLDQAGLPPESAWIYTEANDPAALPWLRRQAESVEDSRLKRRLEDAIRSLETRH